MALKVYSKNLEEDSSYEMLKCPGCNYETSKLYLVSDSQEQADRDFTFQIAYIKKESPYGGDGCCSDCFVELIESDCILVPIVRGKEGS